MKIVQSAFGTAVLALFFVSSIHAQNVGIGFSNPQSKLTVNGNFALGADYNAAAPANGAIIEGLVGIGTKTPGTNLDLNGTATSGYIMSITGNGGGTPQQMVICVGHSQVTNPFSGVVYTPNVPNNGVVLFEIDGHETYIFGGDVEPNDDAEELLGSSAHRWSAVWAANGVIQTSDIRLKTNIDDTSYGLREVLRMRPVTYNWKREPTGKKMLGFIAQDMLELVPEVVSVPKENDAPMGINYPGLIPVLVKAVQQQQQEIEDLKAQNEQLKAQTEKLAAVSTEMETLKKAVAAMERKENVGIETVALGR